MKKTKQPMLAFMVKESVTQVAHIFAEKNKVPENNASINTGMRGCVCLCVCVCVTHYHTQSVTLKRQNPPTLTSTQLCIINLRYSKQIRCYLDFLILINL